MELTIQVDDEYIKTRMLVITQTPGLDHNLIEKKVVEAYKAQQPSKLDECVKEIVGDAHEGRFSMDTSRKELREILSRYITGDEK